MLRITPSALFAIAAAGLFLGTAAADPLLYAPVANGRFEVGSVGWQLGPGTSLGDADYSGDREVIIRGAATESRLVSNLPQSPVPAGIRLVFAIERGTLVDASFRVTLVDLRDPAATPAAIAGDAAARALVWSFDEVGVGNHHLGAADADLAGVPGWADMTPEERQAELAHYAFAAFSVDAAEATHAMGTLLDSIQLVVES